LTGQTIGATTNGIGLVKAMASAASTDGDSTGTSLALSSSASTGYINVSGSGTAGKSVVTVTVTDAVTGVTTTLGTVEIVFYSSTVASLTATSIRKIVGAGITVGCAGASCSQADYSTASTGTPAITIVAKDSGGNVIPSLTLVANPNDATVISSSSVTAANANDYNGLGYYNANLVGSASAGTGKKGTIYYSYTNSDGTVIKSNTLEFVSGGKPSKLSISFDKATYAPGDKAVVTVNALDSSGNKAYDSTFANLFTSTGVTSNSSVQGTLPAASVTLIDGAAAYKTVYAPVVAGTWTLTGTTDTSLATADQGATVTGSATVSSAAESAVAAQIASLITKINALQKLIAKIQKKLGVK